MRKLIAPVAVLVSVLALDQSGLWASYKPADRPEGDLGRYVVTVTWGAPARSIGENRFYIYPYARPQPVTYTPRQASSPNSPGAIPSASGEFGTMVVLGAFAARRRSRILV